MRVIYALAALAISAGPAAAAPKVKRPASIVSVVSRSGPNAFDGLAAFAHAAGMSLPRDVDAAVIDFALDRVGAGGAAGIDRSKPCYLIGVDDGKVRTAGLVVAVGDAKQLAASIDPGHVVLSRDWALLGDVAALRPLVDYALLELPAKPPQSGLHATMFVDALLAHRKDDLAALRAGAQNAGASTGMQFGAIAKLAVDDLIALANDTAEVRVQLDGTAVAVVIDAALVPKASSRFAKFVAAQRASDHALIGELPAMSAQFVFAGRLALGPYLRGMLDLFVEMYGSGAGADMVAAIDKVMQASSGPFAIAGAVFGGVIRFVQVFALADPRGGDAAIAKLVDLVGTGRTFDNVGITTTFTAVRDVPDHDGIVLRAIDQTLDFAKLPEHQRKLLQRAYPGGTLRTHVAVVDKRVVVTTGPDGKKAVDDAIDLMRGHGTPLALPADLAALVDASRARKDSAVMVFDFGAMLAALVPNAPASAPFALSLNFADNTMHARVDVPASIFAKKTKP